MEWINEISTRLATATGIDATDLTVSATDKETLLELAGVAAHSTGDRTNAPILCHVIGRALARGATLDECARVVRELTDGQ
jgi:hypothetical protein